MSLTSTASNSNPIDAFKSFLSERPNVKRIVFSQTTFGPRASTNYYHAASDGRNFFIRQIPDSTSDSEFTARVFDKMTDFRGKYGDIFYCIDEGLIVEDFGTNLIHKRRALVHEILLDGCLNLGAWDTGASSFLWDGENFTANYGNSFEVTQAKITVTSNGKEVPLPDWADRSKVKLSGNIQTEAGAVKSLVFKEIPIRIEYQYRLPQLSPLLPAVIDVFHKNELAARLEIFKLEVTPNSLEESHFAPDPYLERSLFIRAVITANNSVSSTIRAASDGRIFSRGSPDRFE
jgi:hypothetical protein